MCIETTWMVFNMQIQNLLHGHIDSKVKFDAHIKSL